MHLSDDLVSIIYQTKIEKHTVTFPDFLENNNKLSYSRYTDLSSVNRTLYPFRFNKQLKHATNYMQAVLITNSRISLTCDMWSLQDWPRPLFLNATIRVSCDKAHIMWAVTRENLSSGCRSGHTKTELVSYRD